MKAQARRRTLAAAARRAACFACVAASACTYDFDQFVQGSGGAVAGASGRNASDAAGHAGSGGAAGHVTAGGAGGSSGRGQSPASGGNAGDADSGEAGTSAPASGGTSNGGTAGAISTAGKGGTSAAGGRAGDGAGGKSSGAGQGGAHAAGSGGSSPSSGGTSSSTCSGTIIGGHCYFVIGENSGLDWPSAKTACESYSNTTHLVTITSDTEQAAVIKAFFPASTETWIGLSLADPSKSPDAICNVQPDQCPFHWVTGEALGYTDWAVRSSTDKEPNYSGSCVRIQASDQAWADTGCTGSKYRAICEDG